MQSRRSTPARGTSHTPRTHTRRAATTPGGPGGPGGTGGPGGPGGTDADTRDRGTRPLTGTQRAYLTGRADDQLHGGVDCLALFEFTGAPVDPDRMRAAVAALRRHPVLRSTVVDGHHVDAGRDARPPLTVAETTGAGTRADLAAEVEGRRRDILARHADHAAGESGWVDILRWRTDDGRDLGVLHIGVSLAVADLAGTGVIVRELAAAYRAAGDGDAADTAAGDTAAGDTAGTATGPWVTFADIAAREAGPDGDPAADRNGDPDGHREGDDATLPPDPLPAGPDIPLVGTPERTVTRHLRRLDPATWAAVGTVAGAVGATRPALLLAVYRHALGLWCGEDDLTVVVPGLDARRTPDDVLDRTRTWAVRPPSAAGRTLGEAATEAGAELRRRIRAGLDSTDEVRALLHRGEGHSGSLPFVLTCGGEETLLTADVEETFGRLTATGSVTPQVLADLQILHLTPGEVCVALDVRDGAFPATFGPELLATVADALERLAAVGAGDTDTAAPADLPMDRVVRVPRAVAARRAALNAVPPVDDAVATPALHGAWLRQVEARPDATAVVDPARGEDLTYAELHRAACRLAAGLADRVAPGDLVLARLPKGCDQVTAVLAVLYLGAAYLPVNVDAPADRVRAVTEVAQPVAVLDRVDPGVYDDDPSAGDAPGTGDATADAAAAPDLPRPVDGDDRAYVIFTSGSTGTPKGVVMTHRAATTTVAAVVDRHRIGPDDSVLAVSSLDFDLSVFDIFGLLGAGGTVVCIAEGDRRDAFAWCDLVRRHGVTTWNSAPALAEMLTVAAEDGPALPLRRVLVSGDWVAPTLPARVRAVTGGGGGTGGDAGAAGARVVAMGGATEGGIWSNEHVIDGPGDLDPAWPSVPYGRPLPGQAYRVVDAAGRDVPTGVVGELWIGGASLAAGYLGRADLTAERFVTDADGARWYRTGDHGYWGPGDLLFFVGRRDNQVKIRGHRVELGDVEHHLRAVPGVEAAVVLPAPGNTALRALVTLAGDGQGDGDGAGDGAGPSATVADRVREALAATVPGFMVPRDVTVVPELRLTANGKVDRAWAAQVLDGGPAGVSGAAGVSGERTGGAGGDREAGPGAVGGGSVPGADAARAPRDAATAGDAGAGSAAADVAGDVTDAAADVASDIAATWADVLDVPVAQLGGDAGERAGEANFFALGGDSVAATAACSRLRALGYRVTVAELFGNPTLDRFTDAVVAAGRDAVDDTADDAAADTVDDTADDAAVPGGGADRAGAGAADGDADAGAPFPLTPLQRAYALGTDGIRGTVRAATAYAAVLGLGAAAGYGPTRAGFTYPQVKAAAAGIVARWAGLRVVRDGDDAQRVVDPSDALRVTVLDPSTDLRAHLASATPRVPLELVLHGEEVRELGVLVDYLALDGRSLAVVVGALTAVLSGEDPDTTVTVDPTVGVFARHCRALAAGEDRAADATAGGAGADAPDGTDGTATGTATTSPATPAIPPAAAPEPPTLPVAAGQDPSDAGAGTPPAAFTSLRAHIPLATLDRAAARTGATVSAVVLAEFGSALAEASGRGEVGVVVPLTHRPDTGDDREVLGTFSRLGVCACPATPDPAATRDALAAVLTADGGVRAASAGRTGRYPAVFTSVLGYDAALAPATRAVRAVWSLTRTPGVLVDCQLTSVDAGTVEVRWDMPDGVLDAAAVDAMFRGMVERLGGTVVPDVAEITGPLPGGYAPLGDVRPSSTVSALLREVIERLDGEAGEGGARDDALVPWAGPVVAAWRRFVAGGPEATGLADAPVAWSARDAQLLVDVVRGRARRFGILAHPVLSPRALAAAEPTVARALDVLDDRVRRRAGRGGRVAVVELGHGIARGGRRGGSGGSVPGDAADSWTVVEPDALVADIATVDGRTCVSDVADVPAPADVVVACGTLHRDPRLRAGLGAVRLAPGAEVHVVEAERPTAATLVSAALVNPAVLDAAGMLSARGWAEVVSDAGLRVRYLEAEDGHSVVLRAVAAEDGEPTAGVAGAVAGVGSDAGSTRGSGGAPGDAAGDAPATGQVTGRPATGPTAIGQVTGRPDVTAALAASWRRHLPGLADGAGADGADGAAAGALPADTDFFVAGGDSLTATRVLADLREVGVTGLRAVDVFNNPTFGALRDRAAAAAAPTAGTGVPDGAGTAPAAGTGAADSRPAAPPTDTAVPPADAHGTHPLTRVQQAYLAGQDSGQLLGGAPARCLFTFRAAAVDTGRLESAVRAAARRHPVLRTVVTEGPAGTPVARVLDDVPAGVWAVTGTPGATGTDAATTGAPGATGTDAAAALAAHVPDPRAEGPLAVRVSTGPDGATVAVSMNNLLLDGASMMLLMDEIAASYADPATRLDAADASTASTATAGTPASTAPAGAAATPAADPTPGYLADRPWLTDPAAPVPWQGRMLTPAELDGRLDAVLADLPPAPFVPDRRALAGLTDTTMARVAADVDAATWDTVRAGLAARHVTPAAGVLAAFGRALAAETGGDDLTVTLTRFDRDLSVPGIDRALGDFTSLSLAGLRGLRAGDRTVAERSAQTALAEADDPALDALRLTARAVQTSGDPVAGVFPVVFTCGLGLAGATAQAAGDPAGTDAGTAGTTAGTAAQPAGRSLRERSFGTQVAASSTTPQVVLDLQVADDRDGLHLTADHLVRVLPAAVADRVVRRTVAELTGAPAGDGGRSRTGEGDDATLPRPRPSAATDATATDATAGGDAAGGDAAGDAAGADATDPAAVIAEVWADVLGLDRVTDGTNFFRSGGDSLTATRCITALRARGVDAALRTLLTTPDLGDFRDAVVGAAGRAASTPSPGDTPTPQPDAAAGTPAPAPTPTPSPQPDTPADPAPTPEPAPEDWFDLTDVQAGYLMGRTDAYDDGGVACQGYSEFVLPVDRMDPASAADPAGAVRRAWRRVVDAHEMLRALVDREGRQRIDRTAGAHVRVIDVAAGETGTGVTAPDPATARAIVRDDLRERNFPVGEAPMVELALTVGDGDPVLHLSVDLIVTDYVGIRSLVRDLDHCLRHPSDPLDAPAATFRQCLEARARHAATPAGRAARERDTRWWRDRLDTLPPALTFSPDPDATGLGGTTRRSHRLDADAWRGLRDTAARLTVTPSGLVLAAFATAARRYADIALGGYTHGRAGTAAATATAAGTDTATATGATAATPATPAALITLTTVDRAPVGEDGPSAADIGRIVGDFTSTVVLDLPLGADLAPTARDLQGRLFDALDHPAYPGVRVVRDLRRSGGEDRGRIPVVFTSTVGVDAVEPPQLLRAVPGTAISKTPQVLLDVQLSPDGEGVTMDWDSRDGGFHPAVLDALFADVCEVLDQLAVGVVDVPAARAPEPVVRTRSMNGRLLHGRFLRAALDDADAPAVVHGDRTLTRGELCALAVRLAGGLPAGDAPVAVVLPPGPGQVAAQLAALLTGRAFVPLDPEWPGSRRRAVLDTVREAYAEEVPVVDDATLRAADAPGVPDAAGGSTAGDGAGDGAGDPGAWRDAVRRALAEPPLVDDLAYVIFTSGSTGTPKGVAVTHRQVCTTLDEMQDRLELTAADRVLAVSRPSFDLAVFNVFGVLGAGGAVVVPSCGTVPDPETWARDIRRHGVTVWNSVPAQLTILLDHLGDAGAGAAVTGANDAAGATGATGTTATDAALPLRVVLVSGDRVPVDQPARVRALAPGVIVDALGGATEGSIWSIVHRCTPEEDGPADTSAGTSADASAGSISGSTGGSTAGTAPARRSVPYGRALGHQAVWVLDRDGGRAAVGQRGEIVIAGDGVVEGYLGDPVRTAAAFGRHLGTGERCYRTGDVGRYLPDGEIEFCGRVDDGQVKIRGHRIELGEVEAGLRAVDGVADALAAVTGEGDRRELVAVVVPETAGAPDAADGPDTSAGAAPAAPESPAAALAAAVTARSRATELDDAERRDFRRIHDLVTDAALDAMTAQIARVTSASPDGTATRDAIVAGTGAQGHGTLMDRWIDELDRAGRVRCADGLVSVTDTAAGAATDTAAAAGAATDTAAGAARWEEIHRLDDRLGYGRRQLDYLRTSLDELPGLLEGSVDPLSLLFPGGDMAVARASYGENRLASYLNGVCAAAVGHHARSLVAAGRTCRVLEIGAGVGGTTADVLAELADLTDPTAPTDPTDPTDRPGPGVDYLFTDVSRYFTDAAAREWPQVRTGLFDINTDPAEQGVEPGSVDVVLCANVLHNARDIDVALRRIAGMLAPGGVLVVIDSTATNAPLMASMEFKEGLGDATDARLGTGSPFLTFAQWREAVAASPLESVAVLPEAGSVLELGAQHVFIVRKPEVRAGSGEGLDAARVRTAAADVLPASMRPRRVGVVAALPMTANGKRDRAAVAALVAGARPGGAEAQPAAAAAPSGAPAEPAAPADPADPVVDAWREVLDLDPSVPVPGDADFHDLGGDSLLLARCIGQMRRATGREDLPSWDETLRAIVADPTVDGCRRALGLTAPGAATPDPAPAAGTGRHRADTDPTTAPTTAPAPSPAATGGPTVTVVDRAASSPTGRTPHPAGGPRLTRLLPAPGGRPDPRDPQAPATDATTDPATGGTPDLTVVVHDGSGGTGPYTALLRELAARDAGPVVGIERSAGDGYLTTPADELFHDLTERYTVSVLDTGARRVHVVGYCMGGLLAAGIADRLAACGVEATATVMSSYRIPFTVHDEILLDFSFARLMGCRPQDMGIDVDEDALGRALRAAREDGHDDITAGVLHRYADDDLRAQLARAPRTSAERVGRFLRTEAGRPWSRESLDALREVYVHSLAAVAAWSEPPVTVPVTFLRQRDPLSFLPDLGDDMTSFWVDGCLGGLDVVDVDGDHFTCLDAAHAPAVADLVVARAPWAGDAGGQDRRDERVVHDEQDSHDEQVGPAVGTTPTDREEDR